MKKFFEKIRVSPNTGCWLWTAGMYPDGYGSFNMRGRIDKAHRQSWRIHNGEIPKGAHVLHTCDVRSCVKPAHMYLGDNDSNVRDRVIRGRSASMPGVKNPRCKLTPEQVEAIRNDPRGEDRVGPDYKISPRQVGRIRSNKQWKA